MLEIAYKIDHMTSIAANIAQLMEVPVEGNKFNVANEIMEGSLEFYRLDEGLSIQVSKFEPSVAFKVKRLGSNFENLLILDFHLTGVAKLNVTDSRVATENYNGLVHGAYFASAGVESHAIFPPGFYNEEFHIVMDKTWLKDFFQIEIQSVFEKLELAAPFFMYERLKSKLSALLLQIFKSNPNQEFRKSFLHGKTLELLSLFFAQLKNRGENLEFGVSNYNDVSRLFDLMTFVDEHLGELLSLNLLTQKVGFSESKLQKLSRAVLGKSIFQEITERRMLKALEVLGERRHSISEVGHMVGYNNMSHFSRAFKKVNGFLPSDYLKTLP
ncbi:MAG: AraC family transcriptional regulator [Bacteroidota bacterium]